MTPGDCANMEFSQALKMTATLSQNPLSPLTHHEVYLQVREKLPRVASLIPPSKPLSAYDAAMNTPLNDDVRLLGAMLGLILHEHQGETFYGFIEKLRKTSRNARKSEGDLGFEAFDQIIQDEIAKLPLSDQVGWLLDSAAAFRLFLTLTGIAEGFHQSLQFQQDDQGVTKTVAEAIQHGISFSQIESVLADQRMRLVATAHPTTILRQTLLSHQRDIYDLLKALHQPDLNRMTQQTLLDQLFEKIEVLWATHYSRWTKPQVKDEVRDVVGYFSRTLYEALPELHQKLNQTFEFYYGTEAIKDDHTDLPVLVTLGSWVGGDMDGNPFVNAEVLKDALNRQYSAVLSLYIADLYDLAPKLSHAVQKVVPSAALMASLHNDITQMKQSGLETYEFESSMPTEPFRLKLLLMARRLEHTLIQRPHLDSQPRSAFIYPNADAMIADVQTLIDNFVAHHYTRSVHLHLMQLKHKLQLFGFHFATIDLREDTENIQQAGQTVLTAAEAGQSIAETDLLTRLTHQILSPTGVSARQLEPQSLSSLNLSEDASEVITRLLGMLHVARSAHEYLGSVACQNFILSMTTSAEDVLMALLLMKTEGLFYRNLQGEFTSEMNIVPLFETITDLQNAPLVLEKMLQNPAYRQQLACRNNLQIVLLGYSDSNKDGGYFSSNWFVYKVQTQLLAVAKQYGITLRFFHGRGGNIGRGGGPTQRAIKALPAESCRYGQELTEQGEVLSRYYNVFDIAKAHLENLFCAVLQKNLSQDSEPEAAWYDVAEEISNFALAKYTKLTHDNPGFIAYFEQVTPKEVELVQIGSRPARRREMKTVKDLRAIPWVFRWFQARQILPGWYGLGSGLTQFIDVNPAVNLPLLKAMYQSWPFFKSLLENSEIALRQTDLRIAKYYCSLATDQPSANAIFQDIEAEYQRTIACLSQISNQPLLGRSEDQPLKNSISLKEPYLDPLNYIQVRLLSQYRQASAESLSPELLEQFHEAIVCSVEGIATGLGTTG